MLLRAGSRRRIQTFTVRSLRAERSRVKDIGWRFFLFVLEAMSWVGVAWTGQSSPGVQIRTLQRQTSLPDVFDKRNLRLEGEGGQTSYVL